MRTISPCESRAYTRSRPSSAPPQIRLFPAFLRRVWHVALPNRAPGTTRNMAGHIVSANTFCCYSDLTGSSPLSFGGQGHPQISIDENHMARSDLLVALVKAGASGDKSLLRSSAEAIIAEEKAKQHHILADRLISALRTTANGDVSRHSPSSSGTHDSTYKARDLFIELTPKRRLEELVLTKECREECERLVEEQRRADLLRSRGLEPRHRVLLVGPPGNGKTTVAEAIAEALSVPFLAIRYEAVIGSFLGETAARLRRVFDFARTTPCVLFFDEFDVLGKERGDIHETGEIKRVVSSLLLQVDDLPSWTISIAATNHPELLDRAVWRRFQLRIELPRPSRAELAIFVRKFTERFDEPFGYSADELAEQLGATSYSEAEEFCLNLFRRRVLSMGEVRLADIVRSELKHWRLRVTETVLHPKRGRHIASRKTATSSSQT